MRDDVPALLDAGLPRARAELDADDLHPLTGLRQRQTRIGEPLAPVGAGVTEIDGDGLRHFVTLDRAALDDEDEAIARAGSRARRRRSAGRRRHVFGRELIHEEVGTEQQRDGGEQHEIFPPAALHAEPVHRDRGEQHHRERGGDDDERELPQTVHVDQQQLRIEDPDERQDHGAQRIKRALDAGLDHVLAGDRRPRRMSRARPAA